MKQDRYCTRKALKKDVGHLQMEIVCKIYFPATYWELISSNYPTLDYFKT